MSEGLAGGRRQHVVIVDVNRNGIDALAIAARRGYEVTFVQSAVFADFLEPEPIADAVRHADRHINLVNSSDPDELYGAMRQLHAAHPIDAFFCPWELPLVSTAEVASRLGVRFTPAAAVTRCRSKQLAREVLHSRAIPSARYATASNPAEALTAALAVGFPLIVKPASGTGSVMAAVMTDLASLAAHVQGHWERAAAAAPALQRLLDGPLLLEERLVGHMISAEVASNGGISRVLTLTDRQRGRDNEILELGSMMPAALDPVTRDAVERYALQVTQALGLTLGIFHLEIMLTPDGPRLVEANPRVMGGSARTLLRASFGVEILETLFDLHVADQLPPVLGPARACSASHIFGGRVEQVLARDFDPALLASFGERLVAFSFIPRAGDAVPEYRTNYDAVGAFVVQAASNPAALALRDEILLLVEQATGLELVR